MSGERASTVEPRRCVHYVGFRDDRYWSAYRIFGGPRVIHRRWDRYARADIGENDVVILAEGDATLPIAKTQHARHRRARPVTKPAPAAQTVPRHVVFKVVG